MNAGRELDALVAERVIGVKYETYMGEDHNGDLALCFVPKNVGTEAAPLYAMDGPPRYSTDIAAAWTVAEKLMADGWAFDLSSPGIMGHWLASFTNDKPGPSSEGWETSAPVAICLAALAAVGAEVPA